MQPTDLASIIPTHNWMRHGACLGADPELFFPKEQGGNTQAKQARAICADCPVRTECLNYALLERIKFGIWGGLDTQERQKIAGPGRRQIPKPIRHGTSGGSRAHLRRGETPCEECKRARTLYREMRTGKT